MTKTLDQIIAKLPREEQNAIHKRAEELIAEELTLRNLRKAHNLTQKHIAKKLGIGQEGISRLEKRSDLMLSTLNNYIQAMGGKLQLIAEFPGQHPVKLTGLFTEIKTS